MEKDKRARGCSTIPYLSIYRKELERMEDKRIMLETLTNEELEKVFKANEEIRNKAFNMLYEDQMFEQEMEYRELLNTKVNKSFKYNDHYNSFFLTLIEEYKFLRDIELKTLVSYDIITKEEKAEIEQLILLYEHEYYEDVEYDLVVVVGDVAKYLLNKIEKFLHTLEDYPTEEDALLFFIDNIGIIWEKLYILNKEDYIAYEDIAYTKCYK